MKMIQLIPMFAMTVTLISGGANALAADKDPVVMINTSMGMIKVKLDSKNAPISTKNFVEYVKAKHYDGTVFHRVIPSFMIQGGGMLKDLSPKAGAREATKNEAGNGLKNEEGTIAMARTNVVDSATDQFFINVKDNGFLNHRDDSDMGYGYAVFGKVISGLDVVHKIEHVATTTQSGNENVPADAVEIKSITLAK